MYAIKFKPCNGLNVKYAFCEYYIFIKNVINNLISYLIFIFNNCKIYIHLFYL